MIDRRFFTEALAREAGALLQSLFLKASSSTKGDLNNVVTEADFAAEALIRRRLSETFPCEPVLGEEEGGELLLDAPYLWVVDPLDGTNNYAAGVPHYSVSIACFSYGEPLVGVVFDPAHNELFSAEKGRGATLNGGSIHCAHRELLGEALICTGFYYDRGRLMERTLDTLRTLFHTGIRCIRRTGSAALDLSYVAAGRFDGFFEYHLSPWDFAAGMLLVTEAGGLLADRDGSPLTISGIGVIAGSAPIFHQMLPHIMWDGV